MTHKSLQSMSPESLCINTIRTLSMDAVQQANSGHPGTPMALAPLAYAIWHRFLQHNPANPTWFDRDRFVLSCGHASMLIYSLLHLTGYDLSLDDLKNFRQMGSKTPGHPENFVTAGIETTTGPLGQGVMNAVGMAMAEAHLAARFNRPGHEVIDHHTYVIASDGDLMEGGSYEAASLAGHLGLGKLIVVWDDNKITIDGTTEIAFTEDVAGRFRACGWHVIELGDAGDDVDAIAGALQAGRDASDKPTFIQLQTHIGIGAPTKQDTPAAHGSPLGDEEIRGAKRSYGWPEDEKFLVPDGAIAHMNARLKGAKTEAAWNTRFEAYRAAFPAAASELERAIAGELVEGWDVAIPSFDGAGRVATRAASGKVLHSITGPVAGLLGGSADLTGSNKSNVPDSPQFQRGSYEGRNVCWGVREHVMASACNGMALHGGVRPYCATFLVFTDYARPAIRLAALMQLPVIYIMTHDSIGLGEDGPTHQPVEHLAALRCIPGLRVLRPADAKETAECWRLAITHTGPTVLVLTRQGLPTLEGEGMSDTSGTQRGGYVLSAEKGANGPGLVLIATGSEVELALDSQVALRTLGVDARVVSLPSWEIFREQDKAYRDAVLGGPNVARIAIEAASPMGWREWTGSRGDFVGMHTFGASGPAEELFEHFGFSVANVVERAKALLR